MGVGSVKQPAEAAGAIDMQTYSRWTRLEVHGVMMEEAPCSVFACAKRVVGRARITQDSLLYPAAPHGDGPWQGA